MPDAYEIHEARFVQIALKTSAANALVLTFNAVPTGKVWTIISAAYYPSVNESQVVWWEILDRSASHTFPITVPVTISLYPWALPLVTEGMELKLYPGERLQVERSVATAGSTMTGKVRFIESDLPPYDYVEPQERKRITAAKHSVSRAVAAATVGGGPALAPPGRGGGRGGSEPY